MISYDGLIFNTKDVKSVSTIGVLKVLMEAGTYNQIKYFGGIHTGALIALLCVLRFSLEEIQNIVCAFDFEKVYCEPKKTLLNTIFKMKGGRKKYIQSFVDRILNNRFNREGSLTFAELYALSFKHLKLVATNITKHKPFYMDHIHTPNMPVSLAVCIAIQDPCVASPVWYEGQQYIGGKITAQHNVFKHMYHSRFLVIVTTNNAKRNCVYSEKDYVKGVVESMRRYSECVQVLEPNEQICSISFTKLDSDMLVEENKSRSATGLGTNLCSKEQSGSSRSATGFGTNRARSASGSSRSATGLGKSRNFELMVNYGMFAFKRFLLDLSVTNKSPLISVVPNSRGPSIESSEGDGLTPNRLKEKVQQKRRSLEIIRKSIESEMYFYNTR